VGAAVLSDEYCRREREDVMNEEAKGGGPLRVLFLCTHNAARSQMAEALLHRKAGDRFIMASAGAEPAKAIHPLALQVLAQDGVAWRGHPKGLDAVVSEHWDFVITLCDRAREVCPTFPGQPIYAHWGIPDPAETAGVESERLQAFEQTLMYLSRRIDLMRVLPFEQLERAAAEHRLRALGQGVREARVSGGAGTAADR
jgi:protein-tyrosine-phosphatase